MPKRFAFILSLSFCSVGLLAQNYLLNWNSTFTGGWPNGGTSGTTTLFGTSGITAHVSFTNSLCSFVNTQPAPGVSTPTRAGTFVVINSTEELLVGIQCSNNTGYTEMVINFSGGTVTNLSFNVADVDKSAATTPAYLDRITVTGKLGAATVSPTLAAYAPQTPAWLQFSGNTAFASTVSGQGGNAASNGTDQRGTVVVNFGTQLLNSITLRFDNAPGAPPTPTAQAISIGNISFQKAAILPLRFSEASTVCQSSGHCLLRWQASTDEEGFFAVQKSSDGRQWREVGKVPMRPSTNNYSLTDPEPMQGRCYYRIAATARSGAVQFSAIMVAEQKASVSLQAAQLRGNRLLATLVLPQGGQLRYQLVGSNAVVYRQRVQQAAAGTLHITESLPSLPAGVYLLQVQPPGGGPILSQRMMKQ